MLPLHSRQVWSSRAEPSGLTIAAALPLDTYSNSRAAVRNRTSFTSSGVTKRVKSSILSCSISGHTTPVYRRADAVLLACFHGSASTRCRTWLSPPHHPAWKPTTAAPESRTTLGLSTHRQDRHHSRQAVLSRSSPGDGRGTNCGGPSIKILRSCYGLPFATTRVGTGLT